MRKLILILLATSAWAATGDIIAARIVGATTVASTINCATPGVYYSAACTSGAGTGWVLELDETVGNSTTWVTNTVGNVTGEAYSLGIGANGSVVGAKIVVTVTSLGWKADGAATTYVRTLYATHQLRRPYLVTYSAPYPNDESYDGTSTLTMRFALSSAPQGVGGPPQSGYVFASDTSVSVNVAAGIYTYSSTASNAVSNLSVTNNSTLAYPIAIANWSRPGLQRIAGTTLMVCAVGFGQGAHDGKPLAAMGFYAGDGTHTASVLSTRPIIDPNQGDAVPVQEYCGTLNLSGFNQASLATVNFKAFPWIGDASPNGVMDSSASPCVAAPSPLCSPQVFIYDAAGTFGTAAAVVDGTGGSDSDCVGHAVSEATFNANPNSNDANSHPCQTINKAAVIMRAWNAANSSPSRTDEAGTMWVKAGSYAFTGASFTVGAKAGTNPDKVWLNIQPFPGVSQSSVIINSVSTPGTYNIIASAPLHIYNITVNVTSGSPVEIFSTTGQYLWVDHCNLTMTSGTTFAYNWSDVFWTQNVVGTNGTCNGGATSTCLINGFTNYSTTSAPALVRGNNLTGVSHSQNIYTYIGNLFNPTVSITNFYLTSTVAATPVIGKQPIFAFNRLMNLKTTSNSPFSMFLTNTSGPLGGLYALNLLEFNASVSTTLTAIANDSSTTTPVPNVLIANNSLVGQRINRCYNDTGSSALFRNLWVGIGNLYESTAIKGDTFTTGNAARVGNWACEYSVGYFGSIDAEAGTTSHPVGVAGQFQAEFSGIKSNFITKNSDAQQATQPPSYQAGMNVVTWLKFVNRQAWDGTSVGSGNGDYHLLSSSPAAAMKTPGGCVFPYDLDGQICNNSGYGSAGAYEQARLLTPVLW